MRPSTASRLWLRSNSSLLLTPFDPRALCQVNDTMSTLIVASLLYLEAIDPKKPIMMYINSPGGVVSSGLAIYDTVRPSATCARPSRAVRADWQCAR